MEPNEYLAGTMHNVFKWWKLIYIHYRVIIGRNYMFVFTTADDAILTVVSSQTEYFTVFSRKRKHILNMIFWTLWNFLLLNILFLSKYKPGNTSHQPEMNQESQSHTGTACRPDICIWIILISRVTEKYQEEVYMPGRAPVENWHRYSCFLQVEL